ncbi:MAG: hypothetical protein ACKOGP_11100 [Bacteroidota bacterium]
MSIDSEIINNLDKPQDLEKLYRNNKKEFELAFDRIQGSFPEHPVVQVWSARLNFEATTSDAPDSKRDLTFVIVASLVAGFLAKLPSWTGMIEEYYYACNFSFIAFPLIAAYFTWKNRTGIDRWWIVAAAILISCIYINLIPMDDKSDTFVLACIHLPLFIWALVGFSFGGHDLNNKSARVEFLRFNGDMLVMNIIILIAGALLTGLTLGLFSLIKVDITSFYFQNIVIWGIAASPVVSSYLVKTNPTLVNKVSPIIARIFSPMALITLVIYLSVVISTGQDPYTDRDFLILFNLLLIAVMALILFATAESTSRQSNAFNGWTLTLLAAVTIIINGIALSAILFRINEWGITPNRLAVLVGNLLILSNLIWIFKNMIGQLKGKSDNIAIENSIATFLPIYTTWTAVVVFLFPLLFGFQ